MFGLKLDTWIWLGACSPVAEPPLQPRGAIGILMKDIGPAFAQGEELSWPG
jgi:hypothetical protein